MTTRVEIAVKTCDGCPFYKRTVVSAIADAMAKDGRRTGVCEYNARMQPGAFLGLFNVAHIAEPTQAPPANCPLRRGEAVIKIAEGA